MREEVISSGTVDPFLLGRTSSPTPAASSAGASSPFVPTNVGSIDWLGSGQGSKAGSHSCIGSQPPQTSLSANVGGSVLASRHSCRPWERGDLLRRLATFIPSYWLGKSKEASSLACARRGWMNVDIDKIECESCGAQLRFATSALWTTAEYDNASEAFAEQLDKGHKPSCPWIGNSCADSLVQFPPTPSSALIDGFKDRCDGLLQFLSLPVVASSTIDKMRLSRSAQIDRFLSQSYGSSMVDVGVREDNMPASKPSNDDTFSTYYPAQKLISLCGWEPTWLLNVQDCEEHSAQSAGNAYSVGPSKNTQFHSKDRCFGKKAFSASFKDKGKKKMTVPESTHNSRFPLLDCSLCGATVKICNFITVPRPNKFGLNNIDTTGANKKIGLTHGISAASGISGWVPPDVVEKEWTDGRYEATDDDGKSLSNAGVNLNLTMAGGLSLSQINLPLMSERFDDGGLGRDLVIGQPSGSEVGDRAASYESRGPSPKRCSLEDGGSTVDRPPRIQQADSIEGTVIDRDGDEVDDGRQYSDGPSKRARGLDIFSTIRSTRRTDSSGAGPSRVLGFDIDIDVNQTGSYREGSNIAFGFHSTRDSARESSVIAMDIIYHNGDDDSMESVENYPGDIDDTHFPSPSAYRNIGMNGAFEFNYSNQAQQSNYLQHAAGSVARGVRNSSTNEGEETLNAETVTAHGRDRFSFGISGGSVGMGASHEAEIHGNDASVHRADSVVGDAEPVVEITENLGQMGESTTGPGLMDEFVPEEMDREDPHGDSQDVMSQSVGKADSGSKIYGSTKAESAESGEKINQTLGLEGSAHPSLSCNAIIYSGYDASKEEVTQAGKASIADDCIAIDSDYDSADRMGPVNGESVYLADHREFDPISHHNLFCPWVNGNVAAAGCGNSCSSTSSTPNVALCGWQLTLNALDAYQSFPPNQTLESESAASLYKDDNIALGQKFLARSSASKSQGQV